MDETTPETDETKNIPTDHHDDKSVSESSDDAEIETTDTVEQDAQETTEVIATLPIDLDIEAALASVSSLSDVIAEQEAQEAAERTRQEEAQRQQEELQARRSAYYLPRPSMYTLQRGQIGSVIPALMLIALGAGLTFALSSEQISLSRGMLMLIAMGAFGILLIAQWLSSGRWARGALFGGLSLIFLAGSLYFLAHNPPGADGYPLLISVIGLAVILSGILAPPISPHQHFWGLSLIVAGGVCYGVNTANINLDGASPWLWGGVVIAIVVLYVVPIAMRRHG